MHILQQQQLWKDVSYEITVKSPIQMWLKKVGFQKSVSCKACMDALNIIFNGQEAAT